MTFHSGQKSGFHVGSLMVHGPGVKVHPDEEAFKSKPAKTVRLVSPLTLGPKQWTFLFIMGGGKRQRPTEPTYCIYPE